MILAQLQRQRATLCYIPATKYGFCLLLGARLRLWNDSIMHWSYQGNEIPDFFLMVSSLPWDHELWTLPKLQNLYQLWISSAKVTICNLGNTMSRKWKNQVCIPLFYHHVCWKLYTDDALAGPSEAIHSRSSFKSTLVHIHTLGGCLLAFVQSRENRTL